jgi:peptidoglycan/LPS O-acetylase OafA/YrhL
MSSMGKSQETLSPKIHALTSLRFFAAIYVVFHHTLALFLPRMLEFGTLAKLVSLGYVSVSFFFVLSGYILGIVYLGGRGSVSPRPFFLARFARVYPLFLLTMVLDTPHFFLARLATFGLDIALLKTSVVFAGKRLMLHAWVPQLRGIDDPNWSLSVEMLFYLAFPLLATALWKLRERALWVAAAVFYVAGEAVVVLVTEHSSGDFAAHFPILNLNTFALGILLARWQWLRGERGDPGLPRFRVAANFISGAIVVYVGAIVYWSPLISDANWIVGLLIPVFLWAIWAFSHSDWLPTRLVSSRSLIVLGEASFGLYLFHIPVAHLFERLGWVHGPWPFLLFLGVSIGLSVLSLYFFETPARQWILKRKPVPMQESMEVASDAQ